MQWKGGSTLAYTLTGFIGLSLGSWIVEKTQDFRPLNWHSSSIIEQFGFSIANLGGVRSERIAGWCVHCRSRRYRLAFIHEHLRSYPLHFWVSLHSNVNWIDLRWEGWIHRRKHLQWYDSLAFFEAHGCGVHPCNITGSYGCWEITAITSAI